MRVLFACLAFALASGASAQTSDVLAGTSLGAGPATGFESAATYAELRERIAISPVLAIEPLFGVSVESGYMEVDPCLFPPCSESRRGETVRLGPGAALTLRAPEAALPGPLADAHVGVLGQYSTAAYERDELRYGMEAGVAFRVARGLTLGADVQAARYAGRDVRGVEFDGQVQRGPLAVRRTSVVPMLRVAYNPSAPRGASGPAPEFRTAYSLASGVATGFRGGAVQTELRASIPIGPGALAFEPALAWTAASDEVLFPHCQPNSPCPPYRNEGADALSLGAGLTGHSGRLRVAGVPLADAHLGASVYLVNPTAADAGELRFAILSGVSVPVARGVALGVEVQAAAYSEAQQDRELVSLVPMVRLAVGG
ncbi:hypothetical protein [Rubricoccus marinus]|uniref:Outer membrane protein beta-barrel domain-containing protein n=1 Tax=Rubricoccus marinus TaxID=716817 RepID=A0A259TWT9_9BACT|nr:hypothetical protein [Rubricoccus marinus]OZC02160.1 hypothetical protein BSZ36_03660 [Rubricoccus marinus]